MKRVTKYLVRGLLVLLATALLLILVTLIIVQSSWGKRRIIDFAEKQANTMMNARLSIGKLEGNFFSHVELKNVLLLSGNDTIAYSDEIRLQYDLLSLVDNQIRIKELTVSQPYIRLVQLADSTWNLQHLMKPATDEPDTISASPFAMTVQLDRFKLDAGKAGISALDSLWPRRVQDLYVELSAQYAVDRQSLDLKEFRFSTVHPDFIVQKMNARVNADARQVNVSDFFVQTGKNSFELNGNYYFDGLSRSTLNLKTSPLVPDEFAAFLPKGFVLKIRPVVDLEAVLENKNLKAGLLVRDSVQRIKLDLTSDYLIEHFTDSTLDVPPNYDLTVDMDKIDARDWMNDKTMFYVLNGNFRITGTGLDPQTLSAKLTGNLNNSIANGIRVGQLNADVDYRAGNANGAINLNGGFGRLQLQSLVEKALSNRPSYKLKLITQNLNVAPLLGNEYVSDLNLQALVSGSGIDPKTLRANMRIAVKPSKVMTFNVDTVFVEVEYSRQNAEIRSLFARTLSARLSASGNYHLAGNTDVNVMVDVDNAKELAAFAKLDSLDTRLKLKAHLFGVPDNLEADLSLRLDSTVYKTMLLCSLVASAHANVKGTNIQAKADAVARNFTGYGLSVDSVTMTARTDTKNYDISMQAANPDIRASLETKVKLDSAIDIALSKFGLNYKGYAWNLTNDTAYIHVDGDTYSVRNFEMQSAGADSVQTVSANGKISLNGDEDFVLDIRNIDLPKLVETVAPGQQIAGLFSSRMQLGGTARNPVLDSNFELKGGAYQDYRLSRFDGKLGYNNRFFTAKIDVVPQDSGLVSLNASLPVEIRLDSMNFDLRKDEPADARLIVRQIPLSLVNAFYPTDEISGYLQSDLTVKGNLNQPVLTGNINLPDGKLKINKYGIDYRQMLARLEFSNNQVRVDTFNIRSRKGTMFAKGDVRFESDLYEGKMNSAGLRIWFDRFRPIDHKQYNMELSGDINLEAAKDSTRFSGELTIPESMFFVPAVMNLMGKTIAPEMPEPLLVAQLQKDSLRRDSVVYRFRADTTSRKTTEEPSSLAFLDNLQGKLILKIPRNTWIKSDDMRFELGGDIQLIKHKDFFELFGTVNVLRGQYSLLGKVFVIKSGAITFEGGKEMNPKLDIGAVYSFRDSERIKHDLVLNVGGSLSSPEIRFKYQDEQISEGDALSYILFGTNLESLGVSQQESLNSGGIDAAGIAKTAAASLLSSQLTKLMGNTLNMDYIEFKSSSSFDNASFVVGKYLTNNLFVSYEQNIGKVEDKDRARYEMRMEYELFKFLFFQLTSSSLSNGFDLIFKFDEKHKD